MQITILCRCNSVIKILDNCRNTGEIICPNCGRPLPKGSSEEIRALIEHYSKLREAINKVDLYEFKIED